MDWWIDIVLRLRKSILCKTNAFKMSKSMLNTAVRQHSISSLLTHDWFDSHLWCFDQLKESWEHHNVKNTHRDVGVIVPQIKVARRAQIVIWGSTVLWHFSQWPFREMLVADEDREIDSFLTSRFFGSVRHYCMLIKCVSAHTCSLFCRLI